MQVKTSDVEQKLEAAPRTTPAIEIPEFFVRFSKLQRSDHVLVMITFIGLVITGLPQRFFTSGWAEQVVALMGGIDNTRLIHRVLGVLFAMLAVWHVGRISIGILLNKMRPTMLPVRKDFEDAIQTLRYYLGLSEEEAKFDRYDFRQKFEYLGLLLGGMVMIATGFILFFPIFFTNFLPGVIIPLSKTVHGYESMLAFLVIVVWHMYGAVFSPEVFPLDTSIFTGKISRERMLREHPLEFERIMKNSRTVRTIERKPDTGADLTA